ncbi:MAG: DNA repair protein RecO [Planctomycetes bacterium]|nr:DNA repair protein RecO [Planctomycetota bacterium]
MGLTTTHALCLRKVDFSETSQVLTLLTDKLGATGAIAKGAKREKSSVGGPLDLMCLYQVVLYDRTRRGTLGILAQAELIDFFPPARHSYAAFRAAETIRELLLSIEVTPSDGAAVLLLAVRAMRGLGDGHETLALARFGWGLLRVLGVQPEFHHCVVSGREPSGRVEVAFSLREMGILAPPHTAGRHDLLRLSAPTLRALQHVALGNDGPGPGVDALGRAFRLLAWLVAQQGGRRLKTGPAPDRARAL